MAARNRRGYGASLERVRTPRARTDPLGFVTMKLSSPAFTHGGDLPKRFGREHGNASPPLEIAEIPAGARTLALIMDDPDAPRGTFTHWVLFNIPAHTRAIQEGSAPAGACAGQNDYGGSGYGGPRPPSGTHRYFFHLFALDADVALSVGATRPQLEAAIEGHVLENATLMGRYSAAGSEVT